jgi:hypothetical protein
MSMTGMSTIQCPGCQRSLPASSVTCHFCGAALANVPRPKDAPKKKTGPEPWVMTLYYLVAAYWILEGLVGVGGGIFSMVGADARPSIFSYIGIAFGLFSMVLGLGLILRWDWARGVVNIFCWLRIARCILSIPGMAMVGAFLGTAMMLMSLFFLVFGAAIAGLQIWLISETEYMF